MIRRILALPAVLLCGLIALMQTSAVLAQTNAIQQEYAKFKSHDHDEIQLDNGKRYSYTVTSRVVKGDMEIITASLNDPDLGLEAYRNLVVTLDNRKQEATGFAETSDGHFLISNQGDARQAWKKVQTPKTLDGILKPASTSSRSTTNAMPLTIAAAAGDSEKDAAGNYVIDVFMGFSDQAAAYVVNPEATAQLYVAQVNTALKNSNVQGVYLRLIGIGQVPNNPGIVTSVLDDVKTWFKADIDRLQPDLIGMVQMPTDAPGSAAGWAGVGGTSDTQVVGAPWPGAWRHEVGHNVGGMHCKEAGDTGYNYGYSVRDGRGTAMCGNDLAFYSSPLVRDEEGNILGSAENQDMARVWRERMATMATRRIHKVPYSADSSLPTTIQAEDYVTYSDTTQGNQGGAYRQDNVDIQPTTDTGGGYNVGWTAAGEWLAYSLTVPEDGNYEFSYRVASPSGGGIIQLEKQGGSPVYGSVTVPATGGWQNWVTIKHTVALKAGSQNFALAFKSAGFNLNWIHIEKVALADGNYRVQNLWLSDQFLNIEHGSLESSPLASNLQTGQWVIERLAGTGFYRLKNRARPTLFINVESGSLAATTIGDGWWSAQWTLEPVEASPGKFRFKNRWKPDSYINVEGNRLTAGPIQPGWWSAIWTLTAVN